MDKLVFLQDLAIVMAISAVITIFCHRFKLPVVLGYIIAGMVIGPNTPPYSLVRDIHNIHIFGELGVIFLLFAIGLEFSFTKLAKVGVVAFVAATVEITLMIFIGFFLGKALGWNYMNSLFLGAILSISSTTIIAKVLMDTKKIKEKFAQVILGILVIEDLIAIVIIAVLSGIAATGSADVSQVLIAMAKVGGFVLGVLLFGFLLVPRLLKYVEKFESAEMMVITVLGLCFGVSLLAARAGFSVALGAFLIGAIIAETPQVKDIIHKMESIRDMFTAVFFVSVGMLLAPQTLQQYALPILAITVITIVGKVFSCSIATFMTGYSFQTSLKVGLGLAQIGEFSFIIAMLGESSGVTAPFLYPIAVAVSGITALTTPLLMRNDASIAVAVERLTPKPLATVSSFYTGWLERIHREGTQKATIFKRLKPYLPRLLLYLSGMGAVSYGAFRFQGQVSFLPSVLYWSGAAALEFIFALGFMNTLNRFLWNILRVRSENSESAAVHAALERSLRFLVAVGTSLGVFLIGIFYWPLWAVFSIDAALLLLAGAPLWSSVSKAHEKFEATILQIFDQEKPLEETQGRETRRELVKLIQEEYPLNAATEDFLIPFIESAINQPIKDLNLRSRTGATIVSIYRGDESIPNPSAETVLMPGDVLMLMGDPGQIKSAVKYLYEKAKEPPVTPIQREGVPKTISWEIPKNSPLIGKTLREIKLRRNTGATILGIRKEGLSINNPNPETNFEAGDTLMLFGWQDQLERAVEYLSKEA